MTGEQAMQLWLDATKYLRERNFSKAEEIAKQMIDSDAGLIRKRIAEAQDSLDKHPDLSHIAKFKGENLGPQRSKAPPESRSHASRDG